MKLVDIADLSSDSIGELTSSHADRSAWSVERRVATQRCHLSGRCRDNPGLAEIDDGVGHRIKLWFALTIGLTKQGWLWQLVLATRKQFRGWIKAGLFETTANDLER